MMDSDRSFEVDEYLSSLFIGNDAALERTLAASTAAGLPSIAVSAVQGKLLYLLARSCGARRILEVGTLGGYSAIWFGRAVQPDGSVLSLEIDPAHAAVARENLAAAGLSDVVTIVVAPALQTLDELIARRVEPFDVVFIDADKPNNPTYLARAIELSRPGTMIIVDNVIRASEVLEVMAAEPRLQATAMQTVGAKGYDGFALALVV